MTDSRFQLNELLLGTQLAQSSWQKLFLALFRGKLTPFEIKAFLLLASKQGEEAQEITECLKVVRRLEPPKRIPIPFLIDVCGTGGDGQRTFNISTVSAFVIAAAGGYVAKHGNRSVSSKVGSSDLMEALGIRITAPFPRMLRALKECRFAYFHAPLYHPTFSKIQPVRRELGIRTVFNLMGPLLNPIELSFQVIGVSNPQWMEPMGKALKILHRRRAALIRSEDGLDELSTRARNDILYLEGKRIKKMRLDPTTFGFSKPKGNAYAGGDVAENRKIALEILEGRLRGPRQDVVLLNSGFALWLAGKVSSVREGIEKSRWVIRTGRTLEVLEGLRRITQ